jgi:hypothetical protein
MIETVLPSIDLETGTAKQHPGLGGDARTARPGVPDGGLVKKMSGTALLAHSSWYSHRHGHQPFSYIFLIYIESSIANVCSSSLQVVLDHGCGRVHHEDRPHQSWAASS